jgi:hypothetical protein
LNMMNSSSMDLRKRNPCWEESTCRGKRIAKWERPKTFAKNAKRRSGWLRPTQEHGHRIENDTWKVLETTLDAVIAKSKEILKIKNILEEDDYQPYVLDTWRRATFFLRRLVLSAQLSGKSAIDLPRIVPAPSGSIDLLWETADTLFFINFPPNNGEATYSGRKSDIETSGALLTDEVRPEIMIWLSR